MLPPIEELVRGKPDSLFGLPVEWANDDDPVPTFVRAFEIEGEDVYLFEAKHDAEGLVLDGEPLGGGPGWIIEYIVVTGAEGGWTPHRLMQRGGLAWSTPQETERPDTLDAREIRDPGALSIGSPPVWKRSEAQWPTLAGEPMTFVGQVPEPGTSQTVFLFWKRPSSFKAWHQDVGAQTADEHYALEERLDSDLR